jgi:DNA-binding XRE family transcriptional regulator
MAAEFGPVMHRYLEILRRLLLADFRRGMNLRMLKGPRTGVLLTIVREATGLTQAELAERLGVHHTYLSKVANGKAEAGFPLLEKLYYEWEKTQGYDVLPQTQRLSNEVAALDLEVRPKQ